MGSNLNNYIKDYMKEREVKEVPDIPPEIVTDPQGNPLHKICTCKYCKIKMKLSLDAPDRNICVDCRSIMFRKGQKR